MPLPQQIPVRYTEEDAGYVSVRPVVKQVFRLHELADLVVSIAGKDPARVRQIFRSGTAVYHGYRYWWDGIAAEASEIAALLVPFPDDDPSRPFEPSKATAALFEIGGGTQCHVVEIFRAEALEKKFLGRLLPGRCFCGTPPVILPAMRDIPMRGAPISSAFPCPMTKPSNFSPPCSKPPAQPPPPLEQPSARPRPSRLSAREVRSIPSAT